MERDSYKSLPRRPLRPGICCRQPSSFSPVKLDTAAINVMTDFQSVTPVTVRPSATLTQATHLMISRSVRLLFVAEADDVILGVLTARDTMGERPIRVVQEQGGKHGDLRVADIMTPQSAMDVLEMGDVLQADVGHILKTLKDAGRQHALVVQRDPLSGVEEVRGMFSATAIGRRLGLPIQNFEIASTFAEIELALAKI